MTPKEKEVVNKLRKRECDRAFKQSRTFGIYTIHRARSAEWTYSPPFLALSDSDALSALSEMSRSQPEICRSDIYCCGTFCTVDGKFVKFAKPRHVVGVFKKGDNDEKVQN